MANFMTRLKTSFNVLTGKSKWVEVDHSGQITSSLTSNSAFGRPSYDSSKSVLAPIVTRISIDSAAIPIRHVKLDENKRFTHVVESELNDRLSIRANIDQSGTAFIKEAVETMLESGVCALVPVDIAPHSNGNGFDILTMRVGTITQWYNESVMVSVYNPLTGDRIEKLLPKNFVAIAYNPMYAVMNEPNSTLRRLIDRLALLDIADGKQFSPQLDLIIQLPYSLKGERRQAEADRRTALIETQLNDSKYGIAYLDATERFTQLNRPITNDLVKTVEGLTASLHSQLGLTPAIFAGSASSEEMVHYNNRTILPIIKSLTDGMIGSFFSRTAIRQGNTVLGIPSLFKMASLSEFADASDKLTRNEIMTSNEIRSVFGMAPSDDPEADKLRNKNLNKQVDTGAVPPTTEDEVPTYDT